MLAYELFDTLKKQFGSKETIARTNDIIREIEYSPKKYIDELIEECEEEGLRQFLCPLCGEDLIVTKHEEDRGEYQGFNCSETMCEAECSNSECSYTSE